MKVILTGDRGYIGAVLAPMLLERGHDVVGIDSDLFEACTYAGRLADYPSLRKDSRDIAAADIKGADAVIHLAGLSNDPLGDYRPELTADINLSASMRLAELAKGAGVSRFIFASSCSNYGAAGDEFLDENAAFNPVTPYGESKVGVERAVSRLADDEFSPAFLRASTAYGFSPRIRFDLVINNLTAWAFTTGKVRLKSDGKPWRPVVHVEDIARAYIAAIEADIGAIHNKAFNVGVTSENYRIRDLAEIVRDEVPGSEVTFASDAAPDKRNYRVDCNLIARSLPGFKPQWTARRGVRQLYEKFREHKLTLDQFEGEAFNRIAHVKKLVRDGVLGDDLRRVRALERA
ncbi:MAG: NAD-dependent epimerase/dehydratase family protein [Pseudomonadota bacterium]